MQVLLFVAQRLQAHAQGRRFPRAAAGRAGSRVRDIRSLQSAPGRPRPSLHSGCLSNASSGTGSTPPSATCAASRAKIPAGVSAKGSPPESSTGTCQRSSAASTRRASARSGVIKAALRSRLSGVPSSTVSRNAMAMASASSSECAASTTAIVASDFCRCAGKSFSVRRFCQRSVEAAGRNASDTNASRPCAAGCASAVTSLRAMPMRLQQRGEAILRMADGFLAARARNHLPRCFVEIGVEARQHDRALRQGRDRLKQHRGRGHRAGRAGGDDRAAAAGFQPFGLGFDQPVAPFGDLDDTAFGEDFGPVLSRDFQENAA